MTTGSFDPAVQQCEVASVVDVKYSWNHAFTPPYTFIAWRSVTYVFYFHIHVGDYTAVISEIPSYSELKANTFQ
jgi:hypothetical protein